jgi:uncharacterized protein YjbI with pentapeptide repeats
MAGLLLSGYQWLQTARATNVVRVEERLDRALTGLASTSQSSRLAAVVSLNSFLRRGDTPHVEEVLLAFTNSLAIEESPAVRNAIVASLAMLPPAVSKEQREQALASLVQVSRGLVQEGNLWETRASVPLLLGSSSSLEARAVSVAAAIAAMIRAGAPIQDLSRTYLAGADLHDVDLAGTTLSDAILAWANFSGAKLSHASFSDADLEHTVFISADLRLADFSQTTDGTIGGYHHNYMNQQLIRQLSGFQGQLRNGMFNIGVDGPDFTCANLEGANFTGHPLIALIPTGHQLLVYHLSLRRANLTGTKFRSLKVFGIVNRNSTDDLPFTMASSLRINFHQAYDRVDGVVFDNSPLRSVKNYEPLVQHMAVLFVGSAFDRADLMPPIRELLKQTNLPTTPYQLPCRLNG